MKITKKELVEIIRRIIKEQTREYSFEMDFPNYFYNWYGHKAKETEFAIKIRDAFDIKLPDAFTLIRIMNWSIKEKKARQQVISKLKSVLTKYGNKLDKYIK